MASSFSPVLYVFAGSSSQGPLNDLWQHQLLNHRWVKLTDLGTPSPRYNYAYTSYNDGLNEYLAVFGGALIQGEDNALYV